MIFGKKAVGTISYLGGVVALPEPFCWSMIQMMQYNNDYLVEPNQYVHYDRATVSYHSFARNTLVDNMRGDWLLMLDTDHQFEPDLVARMLSLMTKHNVDVLVGMYQYKTPPYAPVVFRWKEDVDALEAIGGWDKNVDLFQIGSAGGGCLLVKKSVFETIEKELDCKPFDIFAPYSEDHSFFLRLKKLGIKAYCAPNIESNHLALKKITMEDFKQQAVVFGERSEVEGFK